MQAEKEYGNLNYSLDEELYNWLLERDQLGYTTSDAELKAKMVELVNKFGGSSRTNIEHWLRNFKEQHEILQNMPESSQDFVQQNKREELNKAEAKKFIQYFTQRLEQENIIRDNIYTAIDMNILWKYRFQNKRDADVENLKNDRLSFMFCTNATGNHKLSPFCIYKYTHQAPKNLKNIPPRIFKLQGNEIQNQKFLVDWYNNYFIKFVKEHQRKTNVSGKVYLLLKNSHKFFVLKNIVNVNNFEILLFPVSTFGILQPINYEIVRHIRKNSIRAFKDFYKSLNIGKYIEKTCKPWAKITPAKNERLWRTIFKSDFHTKEDNVTEEDTVVEEISESLDLCRKAKRSKLEQQGNNVSAEITECIENIESIEENIEEKVNSTADLHNLNKLMVKNTEPFNTLQDDIGSDKIPGMLTIYANAEAEGHQEQKEDIESIAENTQRENYPIF